ncbi:MAG TPA: hypothetical protein VK780_01120, partial [Thermoanaerobaculia bacterium]|nr:hypothetical protein [Thermoanaerobaculia bacterium]
ELNPGFAQAHDSYGILLSCLGRAEWARESHLAQELNPLSAVVHLDAGWNAFVSRQPDEAIAAYRRSIEIEPALGIAHAWLAAAYVQKGRLPDALAEARKAPVVDDSPLALASAGGAMAMAGDSAGARDVIKRLDEVLRTRYVCPYEVGVIHIWLGEKDEAFRWLEKGYEVRSQCMPATKVDPRLDPIRSDPRYADLIRRLAFPP